jgi:hypothetical protein
MLQILLLSAASTYGATYDVKVCGKVAIDFADTNVGEDFWTDEDDKPARGIWIHIKNITTQATVWEGWTPWNGSDKGCAPVQQLDSATEYGVQLHSKAQVDDHYILSYRENGELRVAYRSFTPTASGTENVSTNVTDVWNNFAVGIRALSRKSIEMEDQSSMIIRMNDTYCCGNKTGPCLCGDDGELYLDSLPNKFQIAHEIGHFVGYARDGYNTPALDYDAPPNTCYGSYFYHTFNEKEYQSAAAVEGWAHFYAAMVWNKTTESTCWFKGVNEVDWDYDYDKDGRRFNCELGPKEEPPDPNPPGMPDNSDYLGDICDAPLDNRGTPYDWLRFWWDLTTDQDVPFASCLDIYDWADPRNWRENDMEVWIDKPSKRLRDAADDLGYLDEWDNEDNFNGVHR